MEKANWRGDKFMKWDSCSGSGSSTNMSFEREKTSGSTGYTWPQRNYPCAFCKKQFKSAQALGGHMNVHRRERAQLRSTLLDHYPNPNPNPSPNPKASFLGLPYASYHHSSLMISTPSLVSSDLSSKSPSTCIDQRKKMMRNGAFLGFGKLKSFIAQEEVEKEDDDEAMVLKKKEKIDRLELGLGLGLVRDEKEDLDLELRLGFS